MRDILIFKPIDELKPIGGPAGYLYNLRKGLKDNHNGLTIDFLPPEGKKIHIKEAIKKLPVLKQVIETSIYKEFKHYLRLKKEYKSDVRCQLDIRQYKIIHFHTTLDLYRMRHHLEKYEGTIILTPHSPEPLHKELIDKMGVWRILDKRMVAKLEEIDKFAFLRADYIIFPCGYSDESYIKKWAIYPNIKEKKSSNYRYLLTGVERRLVRCNRIEFRKKYRIPEDAFVIGYVGRHNVVKGYDQLLLLGRRLLERYDKVFFLVGGYEHPLKGITSDRWIETGWISEPQDLINAVDVFILPNKETYFDIVLLEAISLGIPVVASNTGGNRIFDGEYGIRLFDDLDGCMSEIEDIMEMPQTTKEILGSNNQLLYTEFFDEKVFATQYIELMKGILQQ